MIKVEHVDKDNRSGVEVTIRGDHNEVLFEAMSACEGARKVFTRDNGNADKLCDLACSIIRGEVTNDAWQERLHEITGEKLDMQKLLEGFADFLKGLINEQEGNLEC